MIDALLYAVRDAIRNADWGYDAATCDLSVPTGQPPQGFGGDVYVAVHQLATASEMDNALDEYFGFALTLTLRVGKVPVSRIGDKLLASNLARRTGPNGSRSFNARAEQLRSVHHMGWGIIQDANTNLAAWEPDALVVSGFCEPARYRGMEIPYLVGAEWFQAEPDSDNLGLVAALRFEEARRLQPLATFV